MNSFKSNLIAIISSVAVLFAVPSLVSAQELNLNGFSGTMNTTVTSGITVRTEGNNCLLQAGYNYTRTTGDLGTFAVAAFGGATGAQVFATKNAQVQAAALADQTKNDAGCGIAQTDGYGNLSTNALEYGDVNSDDGRLNFPNQGDIVDQTSKFLQK